MTVVPEAGSVLGEFEAEIERARTWRVDWAVGLDVPEYQDPEVARSMGHPDILVPPGSLVFFSFLPDTSWLDVAGIRFDRSLAVRRRIISHRQLYVGEVVAGRVVIDTVDVKTTARSIVVATTIATTYRVSDEAVAEEYVTYSTRHPAEAA